ncbi:hypothetical protein A6R68_05335, partial [Neotoma lepida]
MIWTSVSMVFLLHRHRQRTQHILTSNQDHRGHAETRAAHTILMLFLSHGPEVSPIDLEKQAGHCVPYISQIMYCAISKTDDSSILVGELNFR